MLMSTNSNNTPCKPSKFTPKFLDVLTDEERQVYERMSSFIKENSQKPERSEDCEKQCRNKLQNTKQTTNVSTVPPIGESITKNGVTVIHDKNGVTITTVYAPMGVPKKKKKKHKKNTTVNQTNVYNYNYKTVCNIDCSTHVTNVTQHVTQVDNSRHTRTNVGIGTDVIGTIVDKFDKMGGKIDKLLGL